MKNFMKLLFVVAPVVGIIFYYVIIKQNQIDSEFAVENAKFEREWQEFIESMARTHQEVQRARDRAMEAEEEIREAKEGKRIVDLDKKEFQDEFKRAMQEASQTQRGQN